jgi:hypothetical protein
LIIGATLGAANELTRGLAQEKRASFGYHRLTLGQLASALARPVLSAQRTVPLGALSIQAVTNRAIHTLSEAGALGHYANLTSGPGFARAIANVITELRLERIEPDAVAHVAPDLRPLLEAYARELREHGFTDWPAVLRLAASAATDPGRPSGRRFGALVHAVLAAVNLDASTDEILAVAQANARLIDATAGEIDATAKTVRRALQHPLLRRAARATVLRRETPVQHYRDDGTLVEGVVDLTFQETTPEFNGWIVVDFKIDREIEKSENQYRVQVAAYVEAVRIATACPASGFLLVV